MPTINGGVSSFVTPYPPGALDYNSHRIGRRAPSWRRVCLDRPMGGLTLPKTTIPVMQRGGLTVEARDEASRGTLGAIVLLTPTPFSGRSVPLKLSLGASSPSPPPLEGRGVHLPGEAAPLLHPANVTPRPVPIAPFLPLLTRSALYNDRSGIPFPCRLP